MSLLSANSLGILRMMLKVLWQQPDNSTAKVRHLPQKQLKSLKKLYEFLAEPAVLGFTYIDDGSLTLNQRRRFESAPSLREDFLIKTDDEVCHDIFKKISDLKDPILGNVFFSNSKNKTTTADTEKFSETESECLFFAFQLCSKIKNVWIAG